LYDNLSLKDQFSKREEDLEEYKQKLETSLNRTELLSQNLLLLDENLNETNFFIRQNNEKYGVKDESKLFGHG
jgi:hypothetical protein